ncbi:MAG TPA: DsbA family oxidoreductase [Acetobacteraceae bacterium]|nr:DsbA family oxidoreductase [Acetobacteraceae bacterium]
MDDRTQDGPENGIMYQGRLDIVSDAICPWCYIGKRQLERALPILAQEGLRFSVHWNPFQLNPEMPREGVDRRAYRMAKFGSWERSQELDARVAEAASAVGLTFHLDRLQRTPNTVDAHRLVWLAGEAGVQDAVMEAVFRAYFTEGGDLGDRQLLADCAAAAGMQRDAVLGFLAGEELELEVRDADRVAREAGVNGVPSFFLDGYGLFSGALPAEQIAAALSRAHGVLAKQRGNEAA